MNDWLEKVVKMKLEDNYSWSDITKNLLDEFPSDLSYDAVRSRIRRAFDKYMKEWGNDTKSPENYNSSIEYKGDGTIIQDRLIEICEDEELSPEKMLKYHNLDVNKWDVVSYKNNYWHNQVKGGKRIVLYQSKIIVKPKEKYLDLSHIDEHFSNLQNNLIFEPIHYSNDEKYQMAELNIADLHLGRIRYDKDNKKIINSKELVKSFYHIISRACEELKSKSLDYILFIWSNDFFNSDTKNKTTTAGTPQDTDLPWQDLFDLGVEILVKAITMLEKVAPVKTLYIPSNHDEVFSYHAIKYLEAWFRNDPNVTISTSTYPRQYIKYGKNLLGFCHGDKINASKLSHLMSIEEPSFWSSTNFREFHIAHLHSEHMIQELNGVIVRRIASPTFSDTWTIEKGFVGAVQKAQIFIYDKNLGLYQIINIPVLNL